jgi:hypothetical protein
MFWLSLLVLMLLIAAAPGISMYVEHRNSAASPSVNPGPTAGAEPLPKR